jgi:3-methyladenine DNA glycosylase/8-oxoguanine DNA glycosylase
VSAASRQLAPPERYDLAGSLGALDLVHGDPTLAVAAGEVWWATRTPDGPGTLLLRRDGGGALTATGYGAGRGWLLDRADAVAGLRDDVAGFPALAGHHPVVLALALRFAGRRMPATGQVLHHLMPAILGQKVTGVEARRGYRGLVRRFGAPAPGPHPTLRLPPDPDSVAAAPYWEFHPLGIERRRAETLRRAAGYAAKLEAAPDAAVATRRMTVLPGIGAWTAAEVVRVSHGDPDAVSVGDYHLPHVVAAALADRRTGDDALLLELLEPFRGHRGRVCGLVMAGGGPAQRFGPRAEIRSFARY